MNIVATYSVEAVFEPLFKGEKHLRLEDGRQLKITSSRIRLFFLKGVVCCRCGIEGSEFRLESHTTEAPHLNLYAVREDGTRVLMTKDHIYPKSLGGPNHMDNYQTMCQPCNGKKGNHA